MEQSINSQLLLLSIPPEIIALIVSHLSLQELVSFRCCSKPCVHLVNAWAAFFRSIHRTIHITADRSSDKDSAGPPSEAASLESRYFQSILSNIEESCNGSVRRLFVRPMYMSTSELLRLLQTNVSIAKTLVELTYIPAMGKLYRRHELQRTNNHDAMEPFIAMDGLRHIVMHGLTRYSAPPGLFSAEAVLESIHSLGQHLISLILCEFKLEWARFSSQLVLLQNLEYLSLAGCSGFSVDQFFSLSITLHHLTILDLNIDRPRPDVTCILPSQIDQLHCIAPHLTSLALSHITRSGIDRLIATYSDSLRELAIINTVVRTLTTINFSPLSKLESFILTEDPVFNRAVFCMPKETHPHPIQLQKFHSVLTLPSLVRLTFTYPFMDDARLHELFCCGIFASLRCLEIVAAPMFVVQGHKLKGIPLFSDSTLQLLYKPSSFVVPGRAVRQHQRQSWRAAHTHTQPMHEVVEQKNEITSCLPIVQACPPCPQLRHDFPFPVLECLDLSWSPWRLPGIIEPSDETDTRSKPYREVSPTVFSELRRCFEYELRSEWEQEQQTVGLADWMRAHNIRHHDWVRYRYVLHTGFHDDIC